LKNFNKAQKARLIKVGIPDDIEPAKLTDEQKRRFSRLNIDPKCVNWTRVTDTNDRFLRLITIGQSPSEKGFERQVNSRQAWIKVA
jgi:tetrahydrofolate synthase (fragment)